MEAKELFHADGKTAGIHYCTKCRRVAMTKELAESCCKPNKCQMCGNDSEGHWLVCEPCRKAKEVAKEAELFEKAEKVTEYAGFVFAESIGFNDGYFETVDELLGYLYDEETEAENWPEYCWATEGSPPDIYTIEDIIEHALEEMHEGFNGDQFTGCEQLSRALKKFAKQNSGLLTYTPNYKVAVLLPTKARYEAEHNLGTK